MAVQSLSILGVRVDDATMAEAIATISQFVEERGPRQVATVNPEFIMAAQANADFKQVLNEAALNVPDGIGLVWGGRLLRSPLRERVPGVELVEKLAELSAAARLFDVSAGRVWRRWRGLRSRLTSTFSGFGHCRNVRRPSPRPASYRSGTASIPRYSARGLWPSQARLVDP